MASHPAYIVLLVRSRKIVSANQRIWTDEGSPLLYFSAKQRDALDMKLQGKNIKTALAINYGNPSISKELERLHEWESASLPE